MRIFTDGARFWGGQVDRIDQGLIELGHELTSDITQADLIYSNNGTYDKIFQAKTEGLIKGKIILNVLDLAPHTGDRFPMALTLEHLSIADAVTCISETVQKDLKTRGNTDSTVIYNPMKKISNLSIPRKFSALFVGRVNDAEKRAGLAIQALNLIGVPPNNVYTAGGEHPYYGGQYLGIVND